MHACTRVYSCGEESKTGYHITVCDCCMPQLDVTLPVKRWVHVDFVRDAVDHPYDLEDSRPLSRPVVYVVAMQEPGLFKDVTRR